MAKAMECIRLLFLILLPKFLMIKKHYPEYSIAEELRQQLLKDQTVLTVEDFGAGSVNP